MVSHAYLTIDDSPSTRMEDLVSFLSERSVPALFFCRGDFLEENPSQVIRAVQAGLVLGNHSYDHARASQADIDRFIAGILRTEDLIEDIYDTAGEERPGKHFRFPHIDRGCGGWIVDYDSMEERHRDEAVCALSEGLNISGTEAPAPEQRKTKQRLQDWLRENGFTAPFANISPSWYAQPDIAGAVDCLFTYSTCDWMVTRRHLGKWPCQSLEDLKNRIDADPYLTREGATGIVLAHDQAEIMDVTIALIDHMLSRGVEFLDIENTAP